MAKLEGKSESEGLVDVEATSHQALQRVGVDYFTGTSLAWI